MRYTAPDRGGASERNRGARAAAPFDPDSGQITIAFSRLKPQEPGLGAGLVMGIIPRWCPDCDNKHRVCCLRARHVGFADRGAIADSRGRQVGVYIQNEPLALAAHFG